MFAILMMAIAIVLYTVFFAEKNNVGEQYKPLKMPSGFADRYWNPIIFSILEKNQKPGSKGRLKIQKIIINFNVFNCYIF